MTNTLNKPAEPSSEHDDEAYAMRRERLAQINAAAADREALAARHGQVWDTRELTCEFEVVGFMAPFAVVRRKADGSLGSLEFQHQPRFYFNFHRARE